MATSIQVYKYEGTKSFQVSKWKIRVGSQLFYNSTILSYKQEDGSSSDLKEPLLKYKSNVGGTVTELLVSEGDTVQTGTTLLKVQPCTHPVIMKDLCAECGTDLRHLDRDNFEKLTAATTFSMVHVVPELKVSLEQAEKLGQADQSRLLKTKKLVLLVDLDQTLIHTTNDNVPEKIPNVVHFQLYGQYSPWYHTRLRPGTRNFLENISKYYELHICTFGARLYAHKIAEILDPDGKYFSHRILSRDECFDATSKTANLKALFPMGDHMVCIIDDREDVWNYAPNVIHVKPYTFFRNTGDINAPPPVIGIKEIKDVKELNDKTERMQFEKEKSAEETEAAEETKAAAHADCMKETENAILDNSSSTEDKNDLTTTEVLQEKVSLELKKENVSSGDCSSLAEEKSSKKDLTKSADEKLQVTLDSSSDVTQTENKIVTEKENHSINCADDYLLYLEEILIRVHKAYYDLYMKMKTDSRKSIPDLKKVVPQVRKKVLKNINIVFSSIVPTNCIPETNHFWTLAESLGATVTRELVLDNSKQRTTHVVASKPGTAKVNVAKQHKKICIVSLDWLLCCEERWEHADERLFPLPKDSSEKEHSETVLRKRHGKRSLGSAKKRAKTDEERFSERVFADAGLALSLDDIEDMDKEICEALSEESDEESLFGSLSDSSSTGESLSSGDYPKGWKKRKKGNMTEEEMLKNATDDTSDAETIGSVDEEMAEAVKQEFENF